MEKLERKEHEVGATFELNGIPVRCVPDPEMECEDCVAEDGGCAELECNADDRLDGAFVRFVKETKEDNRGENDEKDA